MTAVSIGGFVASRFSAPLYTRDWVVTTGAGPLLLGERGYDINSYDLGEGLRAGNLLPFDSTLELKQSIVPGFLTLIGTGTCLASSSGPVIFAEPLIRVDPHALVGWADCPSPSHHSRRWMSGFLSSATEWVPRMVSRPLISAFAASRPGGHSAQPAQHHRPLWPSDSPT